MFQGSLPSVSAAVGAAQCGAICWRMHLGQVQILLITSRDTGRWVIPKGWAIDGRTHAQTAAQEAWEEAGAEGKIGALCLGNFPYDKVLSPNKSLPCEVEVFGLRVTRLAKKFPERKERRRKWFSAKVAARKVNEPGLRALLGALPDYLAPQSGAEAGR